MSRARNDFHRHVETCLAERDEMRLWVDKAQARAIYKHVTPRDWEEYGHLTVDQWLMDVAGEDHDIDDWLDWGDETWDAPELSEREEWPWVAEYPSEFEPACYSEG